MALAAAGSGHRPEAMRRSAIRDGARLLFVLTLLSAPVSVHLLVSGLAAPFLVTAIWLVGAGATMALHRSGHLAEAAVSHVLTVIAGGAVLAVADPALADFGMAAMAMGPILAALLGQPALRRLSWAAFALMGAIVLGLGAYGVPGAEPDIALTTAAGVGFTFAAILVAHAAERMDRAYEVYDKAQLNAYRHLIENVRDGVLRFSEEGELLFASHSSEAIFGCRRYELTGSGLVERIHVADRPAYLTAFADANRNGRARCVEVRMRREQHGPGAVVPRFFWAEISLSPVPHPAGTEQRREVVALIRDVTDRKDQQAEMEEARRLAEDASNAKSRFLATIGHELRTPLNAVVGFSEMMVRGIGGELGETHREYAGLIHQSGRHLLEVVGMLLDMSKLEAGKFEIQAEPIDPEALIAPSLGMLEAMARARSVELRCEIARPLPGLVADERACRQIVINLVSNAIKFSNPGGVVTISLKRQGASLNLSVADQGIGMDAEAVARVGEPFFQARQGLDRPHEGTGLGLSIVKGLVDLHEGTLRTVSETGMGTTMTVLLPLNGPSTKLVDTGTVTALRPEPASTPASPWQDEKRKAL